MLYHAFITNHGHCYHTIRLHLHCAAIVSVIYRDPTKGGACQGFAGESRSDSLAEKDDWGLGGPSSSTSVPMTGQLQEETLTG